MPGDLKAYVTAVGRSPEAVFNPLWYLVEAYDWVPDKVYLLWNEGVVEQLETVKKLIKKLSKAYGVSIKVHAGEGMKFDEGNPIEFREKVSFLIGSLKADGHEVVVDMTPGRKFMSALLLGAAIAKGADEITYLHLDDLRCRCPSRGSSEKKSSPENRGLRNLENGGARAQAKPFRSSARSSWQFWILSTSTV